jgi:hypothetical protein
MKGVSLDDLKTFLREVKRLTGKSPIVYSGHVLKGQLGDSHDSELSQYRLWLAQYTSGAPSWPKATFPHGGGSGNTQSMVIAAAFPATAKGNLDLNKYDGTKRQLINEWREEVPAKPEPREKRRKPRQTTKRRPRAKAKKAKARGALRKART